MSTPLPWRERLRPLAPSVFQFELGSTRIHSVSSFLLRTVLSSYTWNSMKCKLVIKLCFSLGEAWVMTRSSKKTCCKELGWLAQPFAKFRASQSSFLCKIALSLEEIQRNHSFAKGRHKDPTSVKRLLWPASGREYSSCLLSTCCVPSVRMGTWYVLSHLTLIALHHCTNEETEVRNSF